MSAPAIRVSHVSKRFRVPMDHSSTLKYRVTHPRSTSRYRELRALDDVTFDVPAGQFLGVTGPNGCGKSTLLKIMSRIYTPDSGSVVIDGRISPFLELGVGFNPELSARENIFLGGAVLGLTRSDLRGRVDAILEFAELEEFADQKLKNFSSGMGVRLAFAVAIQADADVLLMDEVLAVGDARFQEKCFSVFAEYKRADRTIVLVSHDLGALSLYCDRVILINHGRIVVDGPADRAISQYRRLVGAMAGSGSADTEPGLGTLSKRWGSREVEITGISFLDARGERQTTFGSDEQMTVALDYRVHADVDDVVFGLGFIRTDGISVAGPNTKAATLRFEKLSAGDRGRVTYTIPTLGLLTATYRLTVTAYDTFLNHAYDHIDDAVEFRVVDDRGRFGVVDLGGRWNAVAEPPDPVEAGLSEVAESGV